MKIRPDTIYRALEAFHSRYVAKPQRPWDLDHHRELWTGAQVAVAGNDLAGFTRVYEELRSHWQLARGKDAKLAAPEVFFPLLQSLPVSLRQCRLSELMEGDASQLLKAVETLACIKQTKNGPSIMAVSKVLHFFNPRLFVIVDRGMVWDWALNHNWLWRQIEPLRERLRAELQPGCPSHAGEACDPISYVAILVWAGSLIRRNPQIPGAFADYLRAKCDAVPIPPDVAAYEAAAIEWLLLGLVELPPAGTDFP